jgi:hypothetical protein
MPSSGLSNIVARKAQNTIYSIFYYYQEHTEKIITSKSPLTYAWELGDTLNERIGKTTIGKSQYLVVIGYSFPDLNKDIDAFIFQTMTSLKEAYLCYRGSNTAEIKRRIGLRSKGKELSFIDCNVEIGDFPIPPD